MSAQFLRILSVARSSQCRRIVGEALVLDLRICEKVRNELHEIHESNNVRIFDLGGSEIHDDFLSLPLGIDCKAQIYRVQNSTFHFAENLERLIDFQGGQYLYARPIYWYLIKEDYAFGESATDSRILGLQRVAMLIELLESLSDIVTAHGVYKVCVLLGTDRINIPVHYAARDLDIVPTCDAIEAMREELLSPPRVKLKVALYKGALARHLGAIDENLRFTAFLRGFSFVEQAYLANRDNFLSEFEFEKLNEKFERKREEYMVRIDAVCGDLLTKVLALPVAQAIVVSQYKEGADFANAALLAGSFIISMLGIAFVSNQVHAIREMRAAAIRERDEVKEKHPELFHRIKRSYGAVVYRLRFYARLLPIAVNLLILLSFFVSALGYDAISICRGCFAAKIFSSQ